MRRFRSGQIVLAVSIVGTVGSIKADDIVPPGAKLELLYTRSAPIKGGLTEGVAAAPDGIDVLLRNSLRRRQGNDHAVRPAHEDDHRVRRDSHKSNGLMFDAKGNLIACEGSDGGGRCVARWDVKTGEREVIADKYMGKRFNACNDLCIDEKGRIYFTDPRVPGHRAARAGIPRGLSGRYRRHGRRVTHDVEKPNGIAISPDQKTLYVADHNNGTDRIDPTAPPPKKGAMKVYAFPLGSDGLVSGERKTLVDFGDEEGSDGMTVDTEGRIYLAARTPSRPGILVIDPTGREVGLHQDGRAPDRSA